MIDERSVGKVGDGASFAFDEMPRFAGGGTAVLSMVAGDA